MRATRPDIGVGTMGANGAVAPLPIFLLLLKYYILANMKVLVLNQRLFIT
jgi:hypothetical protein